MRLDKLLAVDDCVPVLENRSTVYDVRPFLRPLSDKLHFDQERRLVAKISLGFHFDACLHKLSLASFVFFVLVFESGPAVIKILLASNGESYYIHHLGINSELFSGQLE